MVSVVIGSLITGGSENRAGTPGRGVAAMVVVLVLDLETGFDWDRGAAGGRAGDCAGGLLLGCRARVVLDVRVLEKRTFRRCLPVAEMTGMGRLWAIYLKNVLCLIPLFLSFFLYSR